MSLTSWLDKHLWAIPPLVFLAAEAGLLAWSKKSHSPTLMASTPLTARQQVYGSLTGSSSALLGLALAAVAILAAFGPRPDPTGREPKLAHARTLLVGSLFAASFFLLVILVDATLALAMDARSTGNIAIVTILESSILASVVGLLLGGLGLALVIKERAQS